MYVLIITYAEELCNIKQYQRLFNVNLWRTTLWRVIQTLKYINKCEATYKCWVAQVYWAFLRFSIVQVNMSIIGFVEVFIVCWKKRYWVCVSGWCRGHHKNTRTVWSALRCHTWYPTETVCFIPDGIIVKIIKSISSLYSRVISWEQRKGKQ